MPQLDLDGANSKISADTIRGQSGTTVTVQSGHNLVGSGSGLTALNGSNISSGTVASARLPALGKLVNESYTSTGTTTSNTTTTATATAISTVITPTSASNKMVVTMHVQVYRLQSGNGTRLWLYRDIGGGGFSSLSLFNYYGGHSNATESDIHNNVSYQLVDTSYNSTSAVTYTVYMARSHGSGTVKVNQNNSLSSIWVQEITV